ncbi:GNAT family N-acetyltransferase [Streptomyces sp. NPDC096339]|uniref:GNAT family N-acetyltransferase n=1 Tax=Streptomyces sp. NPDC096339 TaxID=3366086 RepID=UPI0037FEEC0D
MVNPVPSTASISLRPYTPADSTAVLALADGDRVPGQPSVTPGMLIEALEGRSPIDGGWWAELDRPETYVAGDAWGGVTGAISWALRPHDDTGVILWLHCQENVETADALIGQAVLRFGRRPIQAFQFATALTRGLEALPRRHRSVTHDALERAGFIGRCQWRYLMIDLPAPGLPRAEGVRITPELGDDRACRLQVRMGERPVAEAVIGLPQERTGVLWWIAVMPDTRRRGLGSALLGSALDVLRSHGATAVFLYVEADSPIGGDSDRTAATAMYRSAGFIEVDRLYSYNR